MNKKLLILIVVLVIMDIIDGDFNSISFLDGAKILLYALCMVLIIKENGKCNDD